MVQMIGDIDLKIVGIDEEQVRPLCLEMLLIFIHRQSLANLIEFLNHTSSIRQKSQTGSEEKILPKWTSLQRQM